MAFNKKMKINDKWYPKFVLVGPVITTDQVAKHLAVKLMVCPSDVRVVLTTLSGVMDEYMAQRYSVKFDGIDRPTSRQQRTITACACASFPQSASVGWQEKYRWRLSCCTWTDGCGHRVGGMERRSRL